MRRALITIAAVAVAATGTWTTAGNAATTGTDRYYTLYVNEDGFINYDHTERTASRYRVDWPAALLWWNNASINKVKNSAIGPLYDQVGGAKEALLSENRANGYVWDSDAGRKTTLCPGAYGQPNHAKHYRIYADGDDRLYNMTWGYYAWGTTHYDFYECGGGTARFGHSEAAENYLVSEWNARYGNTGVNDYYNWRNAEPYRVEGDHVWENNGLSSTMKVF